MNGKISTRSKSILVVLAVVVLMAGAICISRGAWPISGKNGTDRQMALLTERIEALERRNNELMARTANPGQGFAGQRGNPASSLVEGQRRREQRLREDPAFAEQEQRKRLAGMEQKFNSEPVSAQWASRATVQMEDALSSAATNSGAPGVQGQVDCRSTQCRVRLNVSDDAYDGFITYLSIGMAGSLPNARIVTFPRGDGTQDVSIFASKNDDVAHPYGGG